MFWGNPGSDATRALSVPGSHLTSLLVGAAITVAVEERKRVAARDATVPTGAQSLNLFTTLGFASL